LVESGGGRVGWHREWHGKAALAEIGLGDGIASAQRPSRGRGGMLIFTTGIHCKWAIGRPSRQSSNIVEALFLGPAVVVDDCLGKVIAVRQRFADDLGAPRIR